MNDLPVLPTPHEIPRPAGWPGEGPQVAAERESFLEIDFTRLISLVKRNAIWIGAILAGTIILGMIATMLMTPRYTASSTVMIDQQADQIVKGSELTPTASYQDTERFLQTQVDVLQSRAIALQIVAKEDLAENKSFYDAMMATMPEADDVGNDARVQAALPKMRQEKAADLLQASLSVNLPRNSRLASIEVISADPVWSARLANALAEGFIEGNLNRKFESSAYARNFLADQLEEARAKLETSERELNQYSREAGLIRVSGQGDQQTEGATLSVTANSLLQVNSAANQAKNDRIEAEQRWRNVASVPPLTIPEVLSNQAVQDLLEQKSVAEGKLAEERARHLDDHPTVIALSAQVAQINGQIGTLANSIRRSINLQYQSALDKENSLQAEVARLRSNSLSEQDRGVKYNVLRRVADTNRALYDSLLARYNELSAGASAAANNISVVDRAEVPRSPSSPNIVRNLLLAIIFGSIIAAVFVLLRDHFDDVVRGPGDVEAKLGLPLLGLIPQADDGNLDLAMRDRKSSVSEAYHSLVTNLNYATPAGCPHVLVITSSQQSEGKSTSSIAIASDLRMLGRNVVLVDADLRRPSLHRRLGVQNQRGLSDLLAGQSSLADVLQKADDTGLAIITAGPRPPEPSMLLASPRLPSLIAELRGFHDVIVLDCPPMLGLADTASLSAHADGVLFVVDSTQGHRGAVKSSLRRLQLIKARVLGAILTKFDPRSAGSEYSYYASNYYDYGTEIDHRKA